ncbi:MAG: HprK-related kinase A [Sphingobium sp.]
MKYGLTLGIGPATFRLGSAWREPVDALSMLYRSYPYGQDAIADFTVRLEPAGALRRWWRPSIRIAGDYMLPDAAPMALRHAVLAAEMGMNLQMALGWRRHLLIHAGSVEKDGRALLMTGESGSGKSTLAAMLGERGWRFMGDEFALVDFESGCVHPFPRLISLKNAAVDVMRSMISDPMRFGPALVGTPKGDITHLIPPGEAVARMAESAEPKLLLFPRFGFAAETRPVRQAEAFMRLTQASTNYVALGEAGFHALHRLVTDVPSLALDFRDGEAAIGEIERLWEAQS